MWSRKQYVMQGAYTWRQLPGPPAATAGLVTALKPRDDACRRRSQPSISVLNPQNTLWVQCPLLRDAFLSFCGHTHTHSLPGLLLASIIILSYTWIIPWIIPFLYLDSDVR